MFPYNKYPPCIEDQMAVESVSDSNTGPIRHSWGSDD